MGEIWYGKSFRLGMLGGGQLGRMFIQEAANYDVHVHNLDPDPEAPCKNLASSFQSGSLNDYDTVYNFGKDKDILTVEIENVNVEALRALEKEGVRVYPQPSVLEIVQDKGLQKQFYADNEIPSSNFSLVEPGDLSHKNITFPAVLKLRRGGYDGKGVHLLRQISDLETAFDAPCILEDYVPFEKEISVIVARNFSGEISCYPAVECVFNDEANLVDYLFSPANISKEIEEKAFAISRKIIEKLNMTGILAVEFFLTKDAQLLVNEIAPRPHNSGHHTIECNVTSQFEQHMRSILNLPLGDTTMVLPGVMLNLLGSKGYEGAAVYKNLQEIIRIPGVHVHLYGKETTKAFRKMGHITIADKSLESALEKATIVKNKIAVISQ